MFGNSSTFPEKADIVIKHNQATYTCTIRQLIQTAGCTMHGQYGARAPSTPNRFEVLALLESPEMHAEVTQKHSRQTAHGSRRPDTNKENNKNQRAHAHGPRRSPRRRGRGGKQRSNSRRRRKQPFKKTNKPGQNSDCRAWWPQAGLLFAAPASRKTTPAMEVVISNARNEDVRFACRCTFGC